MAYWYSIMYTMLFTSLFPVTTLSGLPLNFKMLKIRFPYSSINKIVILAILHHISADYGNNYQESEKLYDPFESYHLHESESPYESHITPRLYWDDLRVTWGPNTSYPYFNVMPKTSYDAEKHGWKRTSKHCYNDGHFLGFRYAEPGGRSSAMSLIYDTNGIVSGIQMSVSLECAKADGNPFEYDFLPFFLPTSIKGVKHYTLTVYFVPPQIICTKGRSSEDLHSEGIGTGLWLQNGRRTLFVPMNREEAFKNFGWSKAQCFPTMGLHSFYRMDMWDRTGCTQIWPFALLANKHGQIHGFAFMVVANCHSKRFEHLPMPAIKKVLNGDRCPRCAVESMSRFNLTTMHVYFTKDPRSIEC